MKFSPKKILEYWSHGVLEHCKTKEGPSIQYAMTPCIPLQSTPHKTPYQALIRAESHFDLWQNYDMKARALLRVFPIGYLITALGIMSPKITV